MNLRWKITIGLMVLGLGLVAYLSLITGAGKRAVAEAHQTLRQQGFKTDLADFDFSTTPELRQREHALTNAVFIWTNPGADHTRRSQLDQHSLSLLEYIPPEAGLVVWRQEQLPSRELVDVWTLYREIFIADRAVLDAAVIAALAGPIRFELEANHGLAMLLRHLAVVKQLTMTLGQRAVVELRFGNPAAAWTNLLAATRLVTAWEVEPLEISHLVRSGSAAIVFNATWQMLQTNAWSEAQLSQLQREWEQVDFFNALPEVAAFQRAAAVAACQQERQEPLEVAEIFKEMVRSPRYAGPMARDLLRRWNYRRQGSYDDEAALLYFYRDREMEMAAASKCQTWLDMQTLPGVTNRIVFQSKNVSRLQARLNLKHFTLATGSYGSSVLGRVAEAETRRRLLVTALALERHQRRYGEYPRTLNELAPEILAPVPTDFMDGQPLRYRLGEAGLFILWSVGLDGIDDGGILPRPNPESSLPPYFESQASARASRFADLVWPRPATAAEVAEHHRQQRQVRQNRIEHQEERAAVWRWEETAVRQKLVPQLLQSPVASPARDLKVQGRALADWLRNPSARRTNQWSLEELLTLQQVVTGREPETLTFELPIAYDVVTNLGWLELWIDPASPDGGLGDSDLWRAAWFDWRRADNGNCLLTWETIYESPGRHALQVAFWLENYAEPPITGPLFPVTISNLCQFSAESAVFDPEFGATLRARLPEANARYSVEILTPEGARLKTISGTTTNGIIKFFWDLMDEQGVRFTNNSFGTVFQITLTDSGRTQTMRGP